MTRNPLRLLARWQPARARARRRRLWRRRQRRRAARRSRESSSATPPRRGQEGRHADAARRVRRRLPRPGPHVLHRRLPGRLRRRSGRCTASSPDDGRPGRRTSPTAEPQISEDGKTVTVKIKQGVKFGPPVNREVTSQGRQVRDRALLLRQRRRPVPGATSARSRAAPDEADRRASRPISGIDDAGRPDDRLQAQGPARASRVAVGARDADHGAGARGVRGEVRREEPVDVQHARRRDRPVHDRERRRRATRPATRPASRSTSSATRTGTRRPTTSPAYLDEIQLDDERRPTRRSPAQQRAQRARTWRSTRTRRRRSSSDAVHEPQGPVRSRSRAAATATSR